MSQLVRYAIPLIILGGLLLVAAIAGIAVVVIRRRERELDEAFRASQHTRRAVARPASTPAPAVPAGPVVHVGATEAYGAELQRVGQTLPSADLRTSAEQMVADHQELASIGVAINAFDAKITAVIDGFLARGKVSAADRLRVARWDTSTITKTGEFPAVREPVAAGAR